MDNCFYSCLYSEKTTPDVLYEYCNPMSESANPIKRMKGKRLLSFCGMLKDQVFYRQVKNAFKLICKEIDENFPDVTYQLLGRIKSLISLLNKAEEIEDSVIEQQRKEFVKTQAQDEAKQAELIEAMNNGDTTLMLEFIEYLSKVRISPNPFNDIRDFFAFRIVIEDRKVGNYITEMYNIANFLIKLFDEKSHFELLPSKPIEENKKKKLTLDPELIYIPEKTGILDQYVSFLSRIM